MCGQSHSNLPHSKSLFFAGVTNSEYFSGGFMLSFNFQKTCGWNGKTRGPVAWL